MSHAQTEHMRKYPAADLARNTGEVLRAATVAPVTITKHRKDCYVVMPTEQYAALTKGRYSTQRAFAVDNMPDDLGSLLDQGLKAMLDAE